MALDQDYVVDAAEIPTSAHTTRLLSGLKCEVMLHDAEASLQSSLSFNGFTQFFESFAVFVTVDCCFWWDKFKPSTVTQFASVCKVLGLPLCFCGSSFCAVRPSAPHRHFLSAENVLAINIH
jgi:hypothetical protein